MEYHDGLSLVCFIYHHWLFKIQLTIWISYDGIPAVADHHTLTEILRDEWGYKYWVISDAGATDRLCNSFKMCESNPIDSDAVTLEVLPSGNDAEMGGGSL